MLTFKTLNRISKNDLKKVIQSTPRDVLTVSLYSAENSLSNLILDLLAEESRLEILNDIELMKKPPSGLKLKHIELAQHEIISIAIKLYKEGEIQVEGWNDNTIVS